MMMIYQQTRGFPSPPLGLSKTARELGPSSTVLLQIIADVAASPCNWLWLWYMVQMMMIA